MPSAGSTGGPPVVHQLLSSLPPDFPFPILLVQHISEGFVEGFASWLDKNSALNVHVAKEGALLSSGSVFVAPDDRHLTVTAAETIRLVGRSDGETHCPSVAQLFRSVGAVYGSRVFGILLTGMGNDGAAELKSLREAGAITIAQNQSSCVVFGMPGEAVRLDAAKHVFNPDEMSAFLVDLAAKHHDARERNFEAKTWVTTGDGHDGRPCQQRFIGRGQRPRRPRA